MLFLEPIVPSTAAALEPAVVPGPARCEFINEKRYIDLMSLEFGGGSNFTGGSSLTRRLLREGQDANAYEFEIPDVTPYCGWLPAGDGQRMGTTANGHRRRH